MTSLKEKKLSWIFMNTEKGFLFTTPFKNIHESCRLNLEMNCWSSIGFKFVINYEVIASKKTNKNSMKQFMISVTLVSSLQFFVVHQFQWMINYLNSEVLHLIHLYVKKWKRSLSANQHESSFLLPQVLSIIKIYPNIINSVIWRHKNDVSLVKIPFCNNSIQLNFMLEESQDRHNRIICFFVFVHVQDDQVHWKKL